jgi:hypothetical protein
VLVLDHWGSARRLLGIEDRVGESNAGAQPVRDAGSGGANNGRNCATRAHNTLPERTQPTRSAITDAPPLTGTPPTTPGSPARTHPPPTRPAHADTSAAQPRPEPGPPHPETPQADAQPHAPTNPQTDATGESPAQSSTASTPLTVRGGPLFNRQHRPSFHSAATRRSSPRQPATPITNLCRQNT